VRHRAAIDRSSPVPLFYQLAEQLKLRLGGGDYRAGDRFLTVREVVGQYGVSFVTAQRALARLAQERLVLSERGRGTVVVRSLRGGARSGRARSAARTLRMLVLWPTRRPVTASFETNVSSILDGLRTAVPGCSVGIEFPDELLLEQEREAYLADLVHSGGYAGFCLLTAPVEVKRFFEQQHRPTVVLGDVEQGIQLSSVSSDEEKAHYDLTRHLLEMGHRQIAQFIGTPRVAGHEGHLRGHRRALLDANLKPEAARRDLEVTVPFDRDRAVAHARHLLRSPQPPTAMVCTGSVMAGWLHTVFGEGLRIAYDVNTDTQEPLLAGATVLVWPGYEFGYTAGKLLLEQIEGRAPIQHRVLGHVAIRDC
jgi:DNA-binding transcriptional regulator YhcF (GntR family)